MKPEFWHDRWGRGQIGFQRELVEPWLVKHWGNLRVAPDNRIFVPLCGKSLDLRWLYDQGHSVVGVELSDIAIQTFCMENNLPARRRRLAHFDLYEMPRLALIRGDFFKLVPALMADVGAVYDRAALISWAPELRRAYVEYMADLTPIGAPTMLVTMEYLQEEMRGPPFSVKRDEIERLYAARYEIKELDRREILANKPRMRAKGVSKLFEACYQLIRDK